MTKFSYAWLKTKFEHEEYLSIITNPSHRASVTKLRISCHNLYIGRGRYERPFIPREDRWCNHCFLQYGIKTVKDDMHVLSYCSLYRTIRSKMLPIELNSPTNLQSLLSNLTKTHARLIGSFVDKILEVNRVNQYHTSYYNSQDFHQNTGDCVLL